LPPGEVNEHRPDETEGGLVAMKKESTSQSASGRSPRTLLATAAAAGAAVAIAAATGHGQATLASQDRETVSGGCPSVILYFSRGSSQALDTREQGGDERGLAEPGLALFKSLSKAYGAANVGSFANPYPAVKVTPRVQGVYLPSVDRGVRSTERNVTDLARTLPQAAANRQRKRRQGLLLVPRPRCRLSGVRSQASLQTVESWDSLQLRP